MNGGYYDAGLLLIVCGFLALMIAMWHGFPLYCFLRAPAIRERAGELLARPFHARIPSVSKRWKVLYLCALIVIFGLAFFAVHELSVLIIVLMGAFLPFLFPTLWEWFGLAQLELRERGIIIGGIGFSPWSEITWWRLDEEPEFRLVIQFKRMRQEYPLHAEDGDEIRRVLSEHIPIGPPAPRTTPPMPCANS